MKMVLNLYVIASLTLLLTGCFPEEKQEVISGINGGSVSLNKINVLFPGGESQTDINVSIVETNDMPNLLNSDLQKKMLEGSRSAGPVYEITTSKETFTNPVIINLAVDKEIINSIRPDEDIYLFSVKNGKMEMLKVTIADLEQGNLAFDVRHFSSLLLRVLKNPYVYRTLGYPALALGCVNLYYATKMVSNELKAWEYVEPMHPDIVNFIKSNNIKIPANVGDKGEFEIENYNKKFDVKGYQFLHPWNFVGIKGSQVLNNSSVTCWDVTNLFSSILYSFDKPDLSNNIRMIQGWIDGTRHSWAEVVVDGKVFVVDTYHGADKFRLVERDFYTAKYNLKANKMYTKDPNSLTKYDPDWCKSLVYKSNNDESRMELLKAQHRALQEILAKLAEKGESLTPEEVARMDQLRAEQKKIYKEYIELRNKR